MAALPPGVLESLDQRNTFCRLVCRPDRNWRKRICLASR